MNCRKQNIARLFFILLTSIPSMQVNYRAWRQWHNMNIRILFLKKMLSFLCCAATCRIKKLCSMFNTKKQSERKEHGTTMKLRNWPTSCHSTASTQHSDFPKWLRKKQKENVHIATWTVFNILWSVECQQLVFFSETNITLFRFVFDSEE